MQPNGTTVLPPEHPVFNFGGRSYIVKFNPYAFYLVSKWGYNLTDLLQVLQPNSQDPRRLAFSIQLFAACVGHNFTSETPVREPLTPEQWMLMLPADDETVMASVGAAVRDALLKRLSERMPKAEPTPTEKEAAAPVQ